MLELKNIHSYYGQCHALKGISLKVEAGEIVTLIGGNGAGKTTSLRTISGLMKPRSGEVIFKNQPIQGKPSHLVARLGLAHVPEGRRIFPRLTVRENLEIGAFNVKSRQLILERIEESFNLFPRLKERIKQLGGTLSGGEQQMLAVARALMQDPDILLLDEPSMGLSPIFVETIFEIIQKLNVMGKTILLVEQNALMALQIAHRAYVLQTGQITLSGKGTDLLADETVRKSYLGED